MVLRFGAAVVGSLGVLYPFTVKDSANPWGLVLQLGCLLVSSSNSWVGFGAHCVLLDGGLHRIPLVAPSGNEETEGVCVPWHTQKGVRRFSGETVRFG